MSDAVSSFFGAWGQADEAARHAAISGAMASEFSYADPRAPEPITDLDGLVGYVGMFSANAPGWQAAVIKTDTTGAHARVAVRFGGPGPDGTEVVQHGQYFVRLSDAGLIELIIGFVGFGEPE